jgi:hypothetical protein
MKALNGMTNMDFELTRWESSGSGGCHKVPSPTAPPAQDPLDALTFGEARINLQRASIPTGQCIAFGSVYLESRSSDSFTSAIKDFIAPTPINLTKCSWKPLANPLSRERRASRRGGRAANDWILTRG